jgi:hypothetical protein
MVALALGVEEIEFDPLDAGLTTAAEQFFAGLDRGQPRAVVAVLRISVPENDAHAAIGGVTAQLGGARPDVAAVLEPAPALAAPAGVHQQKLAANGGGNVDEPLLLVPLGAVVAKDHPGAGGLAAANPGGVHAVGKQLGIGRIAKRGDEVAVDQRVQIAREHKHPPRARGSRRRGSSPWDRLRKRRGIWPRLAAAG